MKLITDEQILHESTLEELTRLAIKISSRTRYRANVEIDAKEQCFKVIVFVNSEKESKIVIYRNFLHYDELLKKADECRERLEYFFE